MSGDDRCRDGSEPHGQRSTPRSASSTQHPADLRRSPHRPTPIEVTGAQSLVRSLGDAPASTRSSASPAARSCPAYDPLMDSTKVRHILVRHEQGAGHAAEGYAHGHRPGRGLHGHLGPGRHQPGHPDRRRLHGLGADRRHHRPGARAASIGTDAFQEADIRGITMPITKHNYLVTDPADIPRAIAEAFHIAGTGRPGPVLVDISKDALQARDHVRLAADDRPARLPAGRPAARQAGPRGGPAASPSRRRPVLYVGGGVDPLRRHRPSCARWPS